MSVWVKGLGFALVGVVLLGVPVHAKEKPVLAAFKATNLTKDTKAKDVKKLEADLKKVKGVVFVAVIKKKGEIKVKHTAEATADALKEAITQAGFTLEEPKPAGDAAAAAGKEGAAGGEATAEGGAPADAPANKPAGEAATP